MMTEMDMRNHIVLLANGDSAKIFAEIKKEIETTRNLFMENPEIQSVVPPATRFAMENMTAYATKAEKVSITMDTLSRRIQLIESKAAIQKIQSLEKQLKSCDSPQEYGRINRDLRFLKGKSAADLSELVSSQQQLLVERLNIIQIWKSLLICEIHIFEELKKALIKMVLEGAYASGDGTIQELVFTKLKQIDIDINSIGDLNPRAALSNVSMSNMNQLRETLIHQLDHVVVIERRIIEKKQTYMELNTIFSQLKQYLPEKSDRASGLGSGSAPAAGEKEVKPDPPSSPSTSRQTGMVYQHKGRKVD
ncbi:MAG: hypothetical protein RBU29_12470 [bacterium]|jgi:hypothetical protein|nr:hypothetical protein [bacterium]